MIKIINDNCIEAIKNLKIDFEKAILISDPPYNIKYHYNTYKDNLSENDYYEMLKNIFYDKKHVLIHYPENLYKYSHHIKKVPNKIVSWIYNSQTPKQHRHIAFFGFDPIFEQVGQEYKNPNDKRIAKRIADGKLARLYDWWEIQQVKNVSDEKTDHPCQIPFDVMKRIIGIIPKGHIVIDPFMGSGTTGIACKYWDVDFIGIEIDKKYFDISKQRLNAYNKLPI